MLLTLIKGAAIDPLAALDSPAALVMVVPLAPIIIITFEFCCIMSVRLLELRADAIFSYSLLISLIDLNFCTPRILSNLLACRTCTVCLGILKLFLLVLVLLTDMDIS